MEYKPAPGPIKDVKKKKLESFNILFFIALPKQIII
jgi:hypothetical protein